MGLRGKIIVLFLIGLSLQTLSICMILRTNLSTEHFWAVATEILVLLVLGGAVIGFIVYGMMMQRLRKLDQDLDIIWRNGRWAERLPLDDHGTHIDPFNDLATSINQLLALVRQQGMMLESIALTDPLTQIGNRRAFDERMAIEMSLHQRNHTPLSVLIISVDDFHRYLDYYGSTAADDTLRIMAQLLSKIACRPADLAARISSEEFGIILPATDLNGACHVADTLSTRLAERKILHAGSSVADRLTLSIGVATAGQEEVEAFLQRAEKAAYNARQSGHNTICALPGTFTSDA